MKPIRNAALTLAAFSLLVAPLAGCGIENTVGPTADKQAPVTSEARVGNGVAPDDRAQLVITDPGTPDVESTLEGAGTDAPMFSGTGKDKPKKAKKPKKNR